MPICQIPFGFSTAGQPQNTAVRGVWLVGDKWPESCSARGAGWKGTRTQKTCPTVDGVGWPQAWGEKLMGAFSCLPEGRGVR